MQFEILHFRGAAEILESKNMTKDVELTMGYLAEVLTGAKYKRELQKQSLEEMDWRENKECLRILEGRRYMYKGWKKEAV